MKHTNKHFFSFYFYPFTITFPLYLPPSLLAQDRKFIFENLNFTVPDLEVAAYKQLIKQNHDVFLAKVSLTFDWETILATESTWIIITQFTFLNFALLMYIVKGSIHR